VARLTCYNEASGFQGRDERLLRLPGATICRFLCGEQEVVRAKVWKEDDVLVKNWRIHLTSGTQSKIIKGGSPKKIFRFLQQFADGLDCARLTRVAPPRQRRKVAKLY
jgi:hypothetical protein